MKKNFVVLGLIFALATGCLSKLPDLPELKAKPKTAEPARVNVDLKKVFKDFEGNDVDVQELYMNKILIFNSKMESNLRDRAEIDMGVGGYCKVTVYFKSGTLRGFDLTKTYRIEATVDDFAQDRVTDDCKLPMTGISIEKID